MYGALLRNGKIEAFDALGETGAPVYKSALQIREALKRRAPGLERYLAIPQLSQAGDQIDWYSPIPGQLVPWISATEEERGPAREKIKTLKTALESLSVDLLAKDDNHGGSDKKTFAKLLNRVVWFPGEEYVYLVAPDKADDAHAASTLMPVLTFWGFDTPAGNRDRDPLHCLYPPASPVVPPPAPVPTLSATPAATPVSAPVDSVERPWWRHWLWLLLLPLLLALLLFGLKACAPTLGLLGIPSLGMPGIDLSMGDLATPPAVLLKGSTPSANLPADNLPSVGLPAVSGTGLPGLAAAGSAAADAPAAFAPGPKTPAVAEDSTPSDPTPPDLPADQTAGLPTEPLTLPSLPGSSAEQAVDALPAATPLIIPAAENGAASFLNGQWRAGAGIQDSRTGKPLRLEYQFENGQGAATVKRNDGVSCSGPVTASIQSGALSIVPGGSAACSDGSQYQLPEIACRQDAGPAANCTGLYEGNHFPLSMRQAAN